MTPVYGLIGYPLTHTFSPQYFKDKFAREEIDALYKVFELRSIKEFLNLLKTEPELKGVNVTIPYKTAIMPYVDKISEVAMAIGAVNCVDIDNGVLSGYNTDVIGLEQSLKPLLQDHHTHALVLGTGGSSLAVKYVLEDLDIEYVSVSRTRKSGCISYEELTVPLIRTYPLIINTTPVGMFPNINLSPAIPYEGVSQRHLLYDLVYNPVETKFLQLGKERGAVTKNGLEMLHLQAEESWNIWSHLKYL